MHEAFIPVNDVPTHIMTWGPWIEESFARKEVVICITGNPGLVGYYSWFGATVHEQLGPDVPFWVIGNLYNIVVGLSLYFVLKVIYV